MNPSPRPPLSVMTIIYNGESFLRRCYRNLLAQTFTDWEWIAVNDGSADRTEPLLREIERREPRLRIVTYGPNRGRGYARTRALEAARGDWVAVWDVDDLYLPHRLARVDRARRDGFDYYTSTCIVLDRALRYVGVREWEYFLPPSPIRAGCHAAMAIRLDLARQIGYQPHLRTVGQIGEDAAICLLLPARYHGLFDDEPSFINVIGHEVFLRKSIDANTIRMGCMREAFERGDLPLTREQFQQLHDADHRKLRILKSLRVCPPLYTLIMSYRSRGRLRRGQELTDQQRTFIDCYRHVQSVADEEADVSPAASV